MDYQGRGGCGNVNSIARESYRTLAPGETYTGDRELSPSSAPSPLIPGRYTLRIAYAFCAADPNGYLPLGIDYIRSDVLHGIFLSNAVMVTVTAP